MLTVAESLLRTCEVTFSGSVMRVVKPSLDDFSTSTVIEPALIYLTGIPPGTKDDMVIMYLENKRKSGGGPIRSIQYDDVTGTAVICCDILLTRTTVLEQPGPQQQQLCYLL